MPFLLSESLSGMSWSSNESIHAGSTEYGSGFQTPLNSASTPTSPDSTLRKRRLKHTGSLNSVIREPFVIRSDARDSRSHSPTFDKPPKEETDLFYKFFFSMFGWYPCLLLTIIRTVVLAFLPQTWCRLALMMPLILLTMCLWTFKQVLGIISLVISGRKIHNRTILISGGSSPQALHLARNFHSTGARVIMCEVEGLFALARFSTTVSSFYTVPKPTSDQLQNYVRALSRIVVKEQVNYYVPICATTSAYYDAVAKPHLELLGCRCFCPGIKEVWIFDDTLEVLKKCQKYDIPVPNFYEINSKADVLKLYETDKIKRNMFIMSAVGPRGLRARSKIVLPASESDLNLPEDSISEQKPWVVVQNAVGNHYLTCTVVKSSQIIANVTCMLDVNNISLISVENNEIDNWIAEFFSKLQLLRPVSGHFSFRFVVCKNSRTVIPLSSHVGVSLPYLCFNNSHPKLLWQNCKHGRQSSRLIFENGHMKLEPSDVVSPDFAKSSFKIGYSLDKKKALFKYTDPFPYLSYYYMHLPFKKFVNFIETKRTVNTSCPRMNPPVK